MSDEKGEKYVLSKTKNYKSHYRNTLPCKVIKIYKFKKKTGDFEHK